MKKIILSTVIALVGVGLGAPMIMDAPTASSDIILARRGAGFRSSISTPVAPSSPTGDRDSRGPIHGYPSSRTFPMVEGWFRSIL